MSEEYETCGWNEGKRKTSLQPPAASLSWLLRCQCLFNQFLKCGKRQCARGGATIDEECGGATDPSIGTLSRVLRNSSSMFTAIDAGVELCHVELKVGGQLFDVGDIEGIIIREHHIMEFPILILVSCAAGGFCSFPRVGVDTVKREILKYNLDFVFVGLTDFGEFRLNSSAVRSLIVRELDNRHWGFSGTTRW
jgi:hypothetical protein